MKIVIDTNVVASGVFFGGAPRRVLEAISSGNVNAFATDEILEEYHETIDRLMKKYSGRFDSNGLTRFKMMINLIDTQTKIEICRDPVIKTYALKNKPSENLPLSVKGCLALK